MDNAGSIDTSTHDTLSSLFAAHGERLNHDVITQVFESFAPGMGKALQSFFETPCNSKLMSFREDTFQSVCSATRCFVSEITLPDDSEPAIIVLPYQTLFALIGVMFGEDEEASPYQPARALTNIELHIGRELCKALIETLFKKAGGKLKLEPNSIRSIDWSGDEVEYDVAKSRVFSEFQVELGNREPTLLYIGCPIGIARELQSSWIEQNSSSDSASDGEPNAYWSQQIKNHIDGASVSVDVVALVTCPDTELGVIAGLKPGSVLEIFQTNASLITLECDEQPVFRGNLGKSNGRFAVEVEAPVDHWGEFLCELLVEADKSSEPLA